MHRLTLVSFLALAAACAKEEAPRPVYQAVPVARRDIVVSARANGTIEPDTTVEVKSKASGEILEIRVETGDVVRRGDLLIRIDQRQPRNTLAQAQADLEVAKAQLANAESQRRRADELFQARAITEAEHDQAVLDYANAKAAVVRAQVAVENAQIRLDDTDVRAPISGTVIEKSVERGQVISSPTSDVGGGTVLLKMADLNLVQVRTLVDETDIGKIAPGLRATVIVDAYPNRPFEGVVRKIEPLATVQQNVTMFPVLVRIQNREGLLKPGMNAEVEIHVGRRDGVLAVPNAALRTPRDVASAAQVLGLTEAEVQAELARADAAAGDSTAPVRPTAAAPQGNTMTLPDGRQIPLPEGVTEKQVRDIFQKRMSGGQVTPAERALLQQVFRNAGFGGGGGGVRRAGAADPRFGGSYIVFVLRGNRPVPVRIRTGLTDLDYSEVVSGLSEGDSVLILPSAGLIQSQAEFKERIQRMTGGGIPGMQAQPSSANKAAAPAARP
ncbi:MAG TPA: efflux RND transporter periplasmic adaptor subunit [Gemmatimonadales bacterium]|nr:efflux RND transporter periplasmic adaptor subunit [Gemmatimonadales bacterium]